MCKYIGIQIITLIALLSFISHNCMGGVLWVGFGRWRECKWIKKKRPLMGSQVQVPTPTECVYPRSPALGLGLTASVALMVAQIIINVASGCVCCRKGQHQSASNWTLALICFVVSCGSNGG
ncbi:hypothetical protein KY285_017177 [Solanum tuberosum]|nr:hypothetical protein KY285_017177 [Solanum tuberosum]